MYMFYYGLMVVTCSIVYNSCECNAFAMHKTIEGQSLLNLTIIVSIYA